jgi:hypothetical protein
VAIAAWDDDLSVVNKSAEERSNGDEVVEDLGPA